MRIIDRTLIYNVVVFDRSLTWSKLYFSNIYNENMFLAQTLGGMELTTPFLIIVFMTFSIQFLYYFVSFSFIESIRVPIHTSLWKQQLTCTTFKISIFQVLG